MLFERAVKVNHSTIQRWVVKYSKSLLAAFRKHKQAVDKRWKLDETYVKVKGQWVYLYRAVDKEGYTVDFLLTPNHDEAEARKFFDQAVAFNGIPDWLISIKAVRTKLLSPTTIGIIKSLHPIGLLKLGRSNTLIT